MDYTLEEHLGIKIAKVRNCIKNEMEIALIPYDISTTQFVVLLKLCEKDRMTQKELAKETNYKQSALTLILDKLESKKLIKREAKEWLQNQKKLINQPISIHRNNQLFEKYEEFQKLVEQNKYEVLDFLKFLEDTHIEKKL